MTKDRARLKAAKYLEWADLADKKAEATLQEFNSHPGADDWNFWTQPIQPTSQGRAFANRREKLLNKRKYAWELQDKAKRFREKAENLTEFANRNKGDAEAKREAKRQELDKIISVGSRIYNLIYSRSGTVIKVNTKTYRIQFDDGLKATQPKTFCEPLNQ